MKNPLAIFVTILCISAGAQSFTWQQTSTNGSQVLTAMGGTLFSAGGNGIHSTNDKGTNWNYLSAAYPNSYYHAIANDGANVYAGGMGAVPLVLKSSDKGQSWTNVAPPSLTVGPRALLVHGSKIYLGVRGAPSVYVSELNNLSSNTWTVFNTGFSGGYVPVEDLAVAGNDLLAALENDGVWRTPLSGAMWQKSSTGVTGSYLPGVSLAVKDSLVFFSMHDAKPNLYRSIDFGKTWTNASGSPEFNTGTAFQVSILNDIVYVGFELGAGPAVSDDLGLTWRTEGNGMVTNLDENVSAFAQIDTTLFAGSMSGVWRTEVVSPTKTVSTTGITKTTATALNFYISANNDLIVRCDGNCVGNSVVLTDITGRVCYEMVLDQTTVTIPVNQLNKGIYLATLQDPEQRPIKVRKVLVGH